MFISNVIVGCVGRTSSTARSLAGMLAIASAAAFMPASPAHADHLLITEVAVAQFAGEFIEVHNPFNSAVDLSNYYLADVAPYHRVTCCSPMVANGDFVARFPPGASIPANGTIVVAMNGDSFIATYPSAPPPDFEMAFPIPDNPSVPNMQFAWAGSVGGTRSITDAGEWIVLFHWNQFNDLVDDVDMVRLGDPAAGDGMQNKGAIFPCPDGPDPDTNGTCYANDSLTMPSMPMGGAPKGFSHKRLSFEGDAEIHCNGNGILGDDETSENIAATWDGTTVAYTAPTPGTIPSLGNPPGGCAADIDESGTVDVDDLIAVILAWGPCPGGCARPCPADIAPPGCHNCAVDVDDLISVILSWGACS